MTQMELENKLLELEIAAVESEMEAAQNANGQSQVYDYSGGSGGGSGDDGGGDDDGKPLPDLTERSTNGDMTLVNELAAALMEEYNRTGNPQTIDNVLSIMVRTGEIPNGVAAATKNFIAQRFPNLS